MNIRELRDSRVAAHASAIRRRDLFAANRLTVDLAAGLMVAQHGGNYDRSLTLDYWLKVSEAQTEALPEEIFAAEVLPMAQGHATSAVSFAVREFAHQQRGQRFFITWHHTPTSKPRQEHLAMDGVTIEAGSEFGVPGPGGPGCACWLELTKG